jgi:hypothetical protein
VVVMPIKSDTTATSRTAVTTRREVRDFMA